MSAKAILVFCAQACFIQWVFSQCIDASGFAGTGLCGYDRLTEPLAYDFWDVEELGCNGIYGSAIDIAPTSSGGLIVTSSSAIAPTGISVISDNTYGGVVAVAGEVPFVGTSGLVGIVPTTGAGTVHHVCGNGVTIVSKPGYYGSAAFSPAIGLTGCGCFHYNKTAKFY